MLVAPPPQPVRGPDQITYRLNATWTQRTFTLAGTESIHFRNNGSGPLRLGAVPAPPQVTITTDAAAGTFRFEIGRAHV